MQTIPEEIIGRYAYKNGLTFAESEDLFSDLERFLSKAALMDCSPTKHVDLVWHEFILHTKDYNKYCVSKFGKLIHHIPTSTYKNSSNEVFAFEVNNDCQSAPECSADTGCTSTH